MLAVLDERGKVDDTTAKGDGARLRDLRRKRRTAIPVWVRGPLPRAPSR